MSYYENAINEIKAAQAELKAENNKAELKQALRVINEMWNNSIQSKVAGSIPSCCFDRKNDRIGLTQKGKTKFK